MKTLFPILFLSMLISSCTPPKEVSITFLFDKPIKDAKYPLYFKELTVPFERDCQDDEIGYLLKPINISRLDISNKEVETNAWYFKDIGENEVDFGKLWLEQYFKDSLINPYLTQPSAKEFLFDNWLANSKDSLYILSEESDINEYKGKKVFNNTKELYTKIQESACTNTSGKILVVVNPTFLKALPPPPLKSGGIAKIKVKIVKTGGGAIVVPPPPLKNKNLLDTRTVEGMKKGVQNGYEVDPTKKQQL